MTNRLRLLPLLALLLGLGCASADEAPDAGPCGHVVCDMGSDAGDEFAPPDELPSSPDLDIVPADENGTPWIPEGYEIPDTGPDDWYAETACLTGRCDNGQECVPYCAPNSCGSDGCTGHCQCGYARYCEAVTLTCVVGGPSCCGAKVCGSDCNGGLCGLCDDPAKPYCDASGTCVAPVCTFPTTWSKVGVIATMQTPGDAAGVAACPDFSGDGKGDNGLKALASTINPELAKAIPSSLGILFEFVGVEDTLADDPGFKLVALIGKPNAADPTKWDIDPASFDLTTYSGECKPLIFFDGAKVTSKKLAAGPALFSLTLPIAELGGNLTVNLKQAQLSATLTDGTGAATDGILGGYLTKQDVDGTIAKFEAACAGPNPPSACSYLGTAKEFVGTWFDPELNPAGNVPVLPLCFQFTLVGGTIAGLETP